ncbi:lipoprotein antigen [Mycolicibacterium hassiacum DSM 44199]|uniref:Lipoprotein antigen n=1 Tax=Mycolicibacterium hassiacum (strain DSM 44199 / CIP 105218 / JCM 12690 / 3849) TaxID=1122247 RepID=K5BHK0_MYCHD|nr:lipoprotein LpqH [Mycolicibacterium hassiacum]EKF25742.1 lipoprotein antigen [Mycolicibacterium hassiacum DSM 44199]MBX5486412.1 lipoprotein LpqH [Mycolicibacterium hassiacum]MDA4086783.1 hypothetical protein [Mycolicibacterium hassiacum DSM 44199]VCT92248.1 Lipoprotein LpqH [Mycolicibacterium hassiacum DSM 44199]
MRNRWIVAVSTALVLTSCSSGPSDDKPAPGTLPAGTAEISINGQQAKTTTAVQCNTTGPLTTINAGDEASGVSIMVSNETDLVAESVNITNVGGFTGSYNAGLGGDAEVTMTGRTYDITGTADGFDTENPSFRTSGEFSIKVAC